MNWVGGSLHRSKKQDHVTARQKAYFAKARAKVDSSHVHRPPIHLGDEVIYLDNALASTHRSKEKPIKDDLRLYREHGVLSRDRTGAVRSRERKHSSSNAVKSSVSITPESVEAKRRMLLRYPDWLGLGPTRRRKMLFTSREEREAVGKRRKPNRSDVEHRQKANRQVRRQWLRPQWQRHPDPQLLTEHLSIRAGDSIHGTHPTPASRSRAATRHESNLESHSLASSPGISSGIMLLDERERIERFVDGIDFSQKVVSSSAKTHASSLTFPSTAQNVDIPDNLGSNRDPKDWHAYRELLRPDPERLIFPRERDLGREFAQSEIPVVSSSPRVVPMVSTPFQSLSKSDNCFADSPRPGSDEVFLNGCRQDQDVSKETETASNIHLADEPGSTCEFDIVGGCSDSHMQTFKNASDGTFVPFHENMDQNLSKTGPRHWQGSDMAELEVATIGSNQRAPTIAISCSSEPATDEPDRPAEPLESDEFATQHLKRRKSPFASNYFLRERHVPGGQRTRSRFCDGDTASLDGPTESYLRSESQYNSSLDFGHDRLRAVREPLSLVPELSEHFTSPENYIDLSTDMESRAAEHGTLWLEDDRGASDVTASISFWSRGWSRRG